MKVLHVIPAVAQRYGGPSLAIFEMCRGLRAKGVDVLIATTDADGSDHLSVEKGVPIEFNGTQTIFFPRQLSERFGYSFPLARWLNANVNQFDVVHIHAVFSHPCVAAARACRRHNVPYVVRPLGSLDPWSLQQKSGRKRFMWYAAVRRMLKDAAAIHYTTAEEQRLAETIGGLARGVVVPIGIEADKSSNGSQVSEQPYVLVMSRIHPKKNLESLIDAFVGLNSTPSFEKWRLVIAGDGDPAYVNQLKERVDASGKVLFTGWLSGEEKNSILRSASLLALPSFQENFGICVAEALALGVPVMLSRHVNLASQIEEAGAGWITGVSVDEIKHTLSQALTNADEMKRRGEAGRSFVSAHLGWQKVSEQLVAVYRDIATPASDGVTLTPSFAAK